MVNLFGSLALFLIGGYALIFGRYLLKIIVGLFILSLAADLFLARLGIQQGGTVIIGGAVVLVGTALAWRIKKNGDTDDISEMRSLKG